MIPQLFTNPDNSHAELAAKAAQLPLDFPAFLMNDPGKEGTK
jgi:hypothetical protein